MTLKVDIAAMESCLIYSKGNSNRSIQLTYRRADARRLSLYFIAQSKNVAANSGSEIELYGALSLSRKCCNVDTALYLGLLGLPAGECRLRSRQQR